MKLEGNFVKIYWIEIKIVIISLNSLQFRFHQMEKIAKRDTAYD
jgi:hypothetical protein